jgi:hypothetical protein
MIALFLLFCLLELQRKKESEGGEEMSEDEQAAQHNQTATPIVCGVLRRPGRARMSRAEGN